jgi:acyl carrier protein
MEQTTPQAELRPLIAAVLDVPVDLVLDDRDLFADLAASSLEFLDLIHSVEKHFRIVVADKHAGTVRTVGDLRAIVEREVRARGAPEPA